MNNVALIGRLVRDPELKYLQNENQTAVATFSLAVNRKFKKEGQQEADFINITAWGKTAEFCSKYFVKGQQVGVVGRIQTRSWDDQDGKKRYATDIVAEEVYFADSKREGNTAPTETRQPSYGQQSMPKDNFFDDSDQDNEVPF